MTQRTRQRLLLTTALAACISLLNACNDATPPTEPSSTKSIADPSVSTIVGGEERVVSIMDACDPVSFGAAGIACSRSGGVTFEQFLELLRKNQSVGSWHFAPVLVNARVGQTLVALNRGGEDHTFTEVEEFGGGIVPLLNELSGNPVPAPECLGLAPADFIAPGASSTDEVEEPGTEHYQCCIHPWMRVDVTARP
jgi:plastocyanin